MSDSPSKLCLKVYLESISYSGGNIGNDTDFIITVGGQATSLRNDMNQGEIKPFNDKQVFYGEADIATGLPISVSVTEVDAVYNDAGSGSKTVTLSATLAPFQTALSVSVTEIGTIFGTPPTANFTFNFRVEPIIATPAIKYLSKPDADGWIHGLTDSGRTIYMFYGEKVEFLRADTAKKRLYLRTLEGPDEYRGKECYVTLAKDRLERFSDSFAYTGPFSATLVITPKTGNQVHDSGILQVNGLAGQFNVITDIESNGYRWTSGQTYFLDLPDMPHDYQGHYPGHNRVWFKAREDGNSGAYLHSGSGTLGCITVTDNNRWEEIYALAIRSRQGDDKHIGTVKVTIKKKP